MVHTVLVRFGLVFPKRSCYLAVLRSSRAWLGAQCTPVRQQRNSCVSKLVLTAPPLSNGSVCITLLPQILHAWNEASNVYLPPAGLHRTNHCYTMGMGNQEEIPLKKLLHTGASDCGEMREAWGRSSYSTKQTILLWEQHEYGNHATDALCWTSNICKWFWSSFWCIFTLFTNGFVLNIQERSCFWESGCCRHRVRGCRVWCVRGAQSCAGPLNSRIEIGSASESCGQGKGVSSSQAHKSNAMKMGIVFLSFC